MLSVKLCLGLWSCPFRTPRGHGSNKIMKNIAFLLSILFLAGCAAPPPVKIASKLLGRTVFQQVKDGVSDSDDDTPTTPATAQE